MNKLLVGIILLAFPLVALGEAPMKRESLDLGRGVTIERPRYDIGQTFIDRNHAAADELIEGLKAVVHPETRILSSVFVSNEDFSETSSLARLATSHFSGRITQAGFKVVESRLRDTIRYVPKEGEFALSRETAKLLQNVYQAEALLLGHYTVDDEAVFISAKVIRLDDSTVISSCDYSLPNRGMVSRLLFKERKVDLFERYAAVDKLEDRIGPAGPPTRLRSVEPIVELDNPFEEDEVPFEIIR
jgi:hypothetical protein